MYECAFFVIKMVIMALAGVAAAEVTTECGAIEGTIETGVNVFLGIPYAARPIFDLRWQNSISLKDGDQCWDGVYNATSFGSSCAQPGDDTSSEDCLYLNVWSPSLSPSHPLPTLFYIHGGGYNFGSGEMDGVPFILASNNSVVLVSINYRLNGFGFLALNELSKNSPTSTSGNYGVSDMITALKWVKTNIASFGGDPDSVTIFGQSSGGTGVLMLLISPLATGLFHKAILLSSSTRVEVNASYANTQNRIFVENSNCSTATNVLDCLYGLSTNQVLASLPWDVYPYWGHGGDMALPDKSFGDGAMLGIVDGYIIPLPVQQALASKQFSDVPVIFGSMAQEVDLSPADIVMNYTESQYNTFITSKFAQWNNATLTQQILQYYSFANFNLPQLAYDTLSSDIHTTCGQTLLANIAASSFTSPVYRYIVEQWPSTPVCNGGGYCPHYAFHTWDLVALTESFPSTFPVAQNDKYLSASLQHYFLQFAKNGKFADDWPTINSQGSSHTMSMNFDVPNKVVVDYQSSECQFWIANGFYEFSWNS